AVAGRGRWRGPPSSSGASWTSRPSTNCSPERSLIVRRLRTVITAKVATLRALLVASYDELVERQPVGLGAPIPGVLRLRRELAPRVPEGEHDHGQEVALEAERVGGLRGIRHAVRARNDSVVPGREHHVLRGSAHV